MQNAKKGSSSQSVPFNIAGDVGLNIDILEQKKMLRTEAENVKSTGCGNDLPVKKTDTAAYDDRGAAVDRARGYEKAGSELRF